MDFVRLTVIDGSSGLATMIPMDDYAEAIRGRSPEMAFVALEHLYRAALDKKLENSDSAGSYNVAVIEYMNHTLAAAEEFKLDFLEFWKVPSLASIKGYYDRFQDFTTAVDYFKVRVQIHNARGEYQFSVALDPADKNKIRHFVQQIKEIIDNSPLDQSKKEKLFNLINKFLAEVDRDRTSWQAFAAMVIAISHLGGDAAKELEPLRKFIDSISRLLGRAKEFEDSAPQLPPPTIPRKLPPPEKPESDEEIPF
jgi:hypothetical protein